MPKGGWGVSVITVCTIVCVLWWLLGILVLRTTAASLGRLILCLRRSSPVIAMHRINKQIWTSAGNSGPRHQ
ncbi:hypothetical protein ACET3Z_008184 [Daucus carota]